MTPKEASETTAASHGVPSETEPTSSTKSLHKSIQDALTIPVKDNDMRLKEAIR